MPDTRKKVACHGEITAQPAQTLNRNTFQERGWDEHTHGDATVMLRKSLMLAVDYRSLGSSRSAGKIAEQPRDFLIPVHFTDAVGRLNPVQVILRKSLAENHASFIPQSGNSEWSSGLTHRIL